MKEIKKNYNKLLRAKYLRIGKNLRKLPEISDLFQNAQADSEEYKTNFNPENNNIELEEEDDYKPEVKISSTKDSGM